jgi:NADPH-dependent 2,4-dienoyl-CoA reductase/sulfur reductase-like enzyme/bacterioferritin-associated ferredoxin
VFPVPTTVSKGMLVIPTVEGTVLLGPTADKVEDKEDRGTDEENMREIVRSAQQLIPSVSEQDIITSFSGLRPTLEGDDFRIEESEAVPGFFQVAGIQSPGLTAAPAVAEYVKDLLKAGGCRLTEKSQYKATAPEVRRTRTKSDDEINEDWRDDPDAGTIVCRCESVTRQEVLQAVHAGHTTVDGVKFYSRATAGRCQGGFCLPRILAIISEVTGTPVTEITKRGGKSTIVDSALPGTEPYPAPAFVNREAKVPDSVDTIILGGGAAGMAAASEIAGAGYLPLVVDREDRLGGVLRQCVHNGFGIHEFKAELTGPEYAEHYVDEVSDRDVPVLTGSTVLAVEPAPDGFVAKVLSRERGLQRIHAKSVGLAMGSRERNRGSIRIPGTRPSGVLTAGSAQRLVNIDGYAPGKRAVIIGSGDIGLIMARRMKFIGGDVEAVIEIQPVPSGLNRNIVQCLDDFGIPLYLGHVVTEIKGRERVTDVTVAPLENGVPRRDRSFSLSCDTLLLSVGLIPENEISRALGVELHSQTGGPVVDSRLMTSYDGVFASGNVLHIHDVVDFVAEESRRMGVAVVEYLEGKPRPDEIGISAGSNVRYVMPSRLRLDGDNRLYLRSFIAKVGATVELRVDGNVINTYKQHHVQPSEMISIDLAGSEVDPEAGRVEVAVV